MTTPAQFPVTIGKITLKDRKGPRTDLRTKASIRVHASLLRSVSSSKAAMRVGE